MMEAQDAAATQAQGMPTTDGTPATQETPKPPQPAPMEPDAMCELRYPLVRGRLALGPDSRLHAAVCALVSSWHGEDGRGVQIVGGVGEGRCLLVRAPLAKIGQARALEGQEMRVGHTRFLLGTMQARALPAFLEPVTLGAALVCPTFTKSGEGRSGYSEARFGEWLGRALDGLDVRRVVVGPQGVLMLHGSLYHIGHAVALHDVSPQAARVLLARGLGGKGKMGCGCLLTVEDWPDLGAGCWPTQTPQGGRYRAAEQDAGMGAPPNRRPQEKGSWAGI